MRSYLSNLVVKSDLGKTSALTKPEEKYSKDVEYMFGGKRPQFLELLPPFNNSETDRKSYSTLLKLQVIIEILL